MKNLRKIHVYVGCVFAPMLIFFALSGLWQTLGLHQVGKKADRGVPALQAQLQRLSRAHMQVRSLHERSPGESFEVSPWRWRDSDRKEMPYTVFLCLMSLGLILTTALGVVMAFRFGSSAKTVAACLVFGIACPVILFYLKM